MLKKTITFEDLDGNSITEDFYFNLSRVEITEMGVGGFEDNLQQMLKAKDIQKILELFKKIIASAVGKRSEDGRRFVKSEEIANDFLQTEAFSELFMELIQDDGTKVVEFFKGMLPSSMGDKLSEKTSDATILPVNPPKIEEKVDPKPWITENRKPTQKELMGMSKEDLLEAMKLATDDLAQSKKEVFGD